MSNCSRPFAVGIENRLVRRAGFSTGSGAAASPAAAAATPAPPCTLAELGAACRVASDAARGRGEVRGELGRGEPEATLNGAGGAGAGSSSVVFVSFAGAGCVCSNAATSLSAASAILARRPLDIGEKEAAVGAADDEEEEGESTEPRPGTDGMEVAGWDG